MKPSETPIMPKTFGRCQLLIEVAAFVVLAAASSLWFAPGDAVTVAAAMAVAYALPVALFRHSGAYSATGRYVMLAIAVTMAAFATIGIWHCTLWRGHTLADPVLFSDDSSYWDWAVKYSGNGGVEELHRTAFPGLPLLSALLLKLLGKSVLWPIAMNCTFTLMAILFFALAARNMLQGKVEAQPARVVWVSMALCGALFYFLSQGIRLQKEASMYLGMGAASYVFSKMCCGSRLGWRDWLAFAVAMLIMALVRTTYVYFVMLGAAVALVPMLRQRQWVQPLALLAVTAAAFAVGNFFAIYSIDHHVAIVEGGNSMKRLYVVGPTQQPYLDMLGNYFNYPVWKRLLLLPLTSAVQFVIPFPWIYGGVQLSDVLTRCGWGWYAVGGTAMFYYLWCVAKRSNPLGALAWWPPLCFAVTAYVVAGSLNRYALPIEPLFVPMAVYVLCKVRKGVLARPFKWWCVAFGVALAVTLVLCYRVQIGYLDGLEKYYQTLKLLRG